MAPAFSIPTLHYDLLISAEQPFPSHLTLQLGLMYGTVNVTWPVSPTVSVSSDTPFSLQLPNVPRGNSVTVVVVTRARSYTLSLHNPCGLAAGDRLSAGLRCSGGAVCLPLGPVDWVCTPTMQTGTLQLMGHPTATATRAGVTLVTLPPLTEPSITAGLQLRVSSQLFASQPSLATFSAFSALSLGFVSNFASPVAVGVIVSNLCVGSSLSDLCDQRRSCCARCPQT